MSKTLQQLAKDYWPLIAFIFLFGAVFAENQVVDTQQTKDITTVTNETQSIRDDLQAIKDTLKTSSFERRMMQRDISEIRAAILGERE